MIEKILQIVLGVVVVIAYLAASVVVWRRMMNQEYGCWATYKLLPIFAAGMFVCYTFYLLYKIMVEIGKGVGWLFGYRDRE